MNRKRLFISAALIVVVGLLVCAALMWQSAIAPITATKPTDTASIKRGARVVAQGDCAVCHTTQGGAYMAGGLPLVTPFGTLYTTNITPDVATGIGNWSSEAFTRALRDGVSRDGHLLYPALPYVHYRRMSDADIADAYAYLMSVEPVAFTPPANHMMFPMGFRPLVAFWNLLYRHGEPIVDLPDHSAEWNRGRYLAEGAGHCSSCHTPLDLIGGEKTSHLYQGSLVDGWDTPAIASLADSANPWSKAQLVAYLRGEVADVHGAAAGPMLPVSLSLAEVPIADVQAIATYVLDLKNPADAKPADCGTSPPPQPATSTPSAGEALFAGACASCHAPGAPMRIQGGRPGLATATALRADSPRNLTQVMLTGIPLGTTTDSHYMPAFADILNTSQMAAIAEYLRSTACPTRPWSDLEKTIATIRQQGEQK
ncbi:MAG: cytochrome c [Pseudomonas sp.]